MTPLTHFKKHKGDRALCNKVTTRFSETPTCALCQALIRRQWEQAKEEILKPVTMSGSSTEGGDW